MILIAFILIIITLFVLRYVFVDKSARKSLKNRHVVITGGSSGIGKSVALLATKQGAHVTITARDPVKLEATLNEMKSNLIDPEQQVRYVVTDVTNYGNVLETLERIDDTLPVYMLVNCAGMAICGRVEDLTIEDDRKLFDLNYFGTLYPIKVIAPRMKLRNEGIIVLTGSQGSLMGIYGLGSYSASKFALRGLAESLHMELKPYNVSVTVSLPPDTDTPGYANENKSKPKETHLISESGGLFPPEQVGKQLLEDALIGKFFSFVGFESFMLTTLCSGMSPFNTFLDVCIQTLLLGLFRFIGSFYILKFQKIIQQFKQKKDQ